MLREIFVSVHDAERHDTRMAAALFHSLLQERMRVRARAHVHEECVH
jgi:hypothetical protein